jgi:mRNA interferase HicA
VKRRDLIKQLMKEARTRQVSFVFVREGANHTVYSFGGQNVIIPRHAEINERTALSILKEVGIK